MITVYRGEQKTYNLKSNTFEKGIPTLVPRDLEMDIKNNSDFELYDSKSEYPEGKPILVILPNKFDWIVGSQVLIDRIKSGFPTCPIDIVIANEFSDFISGGNKTNHIPPAKNYYRIYDLSLHKNMGWTGDHNLKGHSRAELLLMMAKLFDINTDNKFIFKINKHVEKTIDLLIIKNGRNIGSTLENTDTIIEAIQKAFPEIKIEIIDSSLKNYPIVDKAKFVLSLGESDLSYYATVCGIDHLVFINSFFSKKIEFEYLKYSDTTKIAPIIEMQESNINNLIGYLKSALENKQTQGVIEEGLENEQDIRQDSGGESQTREKKRFGFKRKDNED